jgi:hypothetical protein
LSSYFQNFGTNHAYNYSLTKLGQVYRLYEKQMMHWEKVLQLPLLHVQYENVVHDFDRECRRIVEFCGLPWNDACLDFHKSQRPVETASYSQVRRPLYSSSVGRWRHYEKHLEPLRKALAR